MKMFVNNSEVNLRLHISPLVDMLNDGESHLVCHIHVIPKVIRNFTHSSMKHLPIYFTSSLPFSVSAILVDVPGHV